MLNGGHSVRCQVASLSRCSVVGESCSSLLILKLVILKLISHFSLGILLFHRQGINFIRLSIFQNILIFILKPRKILVKYV